MNLLEESLARQLQIVQEGRMSPEVQDLRRQLREQTEIAANLSRELEECQRDTERRLHELYQDIHARPGPQIPVHLYVEGRRGPRPYAQHTFHAQVSIDLDHLDRVHHHDPVMRYLSEYLADALAREIQAFSLPNPTYRTKSTTYLP